MCGAALTAIDELVMMIAPPWPCLISTGTAALQVCQTPVSTMSTVSCHSSSVSS